MKLGKLLLIFSLVLVLPGFAQDTLETEENTTEINVKDADIAAVVRIFGKKTKRNYIIDEKVKGKISIFLPGKVSAEEADRILDSVLAMKGFTAVPIGDNLWKIVPSPEAKQTTIPTVKDIEGRGSPAMVTRVVNLKYVGADEVKQLIQPLVSSSGLLNAYTGTNSLIMIDHEENIKRLVEIIESFDIPYTNREMTIIPIQHAEAVDIAEKIDQILNEANNQNNPNNAFEAAAASFNTRARQASANMAGATGTNVAGLNTATASETSTLTVNAKTQAPKIIADERTNSIILVADEDTTARIRALIGELDSPVDRSGNRFYVYRCQHANAEELAEVLSGLGGGGGATGSSGLGGAFGNTNDDSLPFSGRGINTNSRNRGNRTQNTQGRLSDQYRTPGRSRSENNTSRGTVSAQLGEDVSITADPSTNSLIINSNKTDYEKILELLKKIDIKRRQILVQAMILEVGIDDSTEYASNFLVSGGGDDGGVIAVNNTGELTQLLSNPAQLSKFTVAAASAGVVKLPGGITLPSQSILMSAVRNNSNVNILSAPNILATDNEEAEIVVGENVPFLASTATASENLNNTFNQIDRQDVGITLRITPQISSSDFVTLSMFTEVSSVVPGTAGSELGPTTTIRTSDTTAICKDSQMIAIGGLMADVITETDGGVPFLKDIPVIGHIFRSANDRQRRTNLLIFITPTIIRDQFDARDMTLEKRDGLSKDFHNYAVYPDRSEELYDSNLDKVTEGKFYEGPPPGTILPPIKSETIDEPLVETTETNKAVNGTKPRTFKVTPKLPTAAKTSIDSLAMNLLGQTKNASNKYIVLEAAKTSSSVPFKIDSKNKLVNILVPSEAPAAAQNFFNSGENYAYLTGENDKLTMRVLGVFDSAAAALDFFDSKNNDKNRVDWYSLSAHEILNLGKQPWVKQ